MVGRDHSHPAECIICCWGRRALTQNFEGSQRRRPIRPGFSSVFRRHCLSRLLIVSFDLRE
jgi:hypothetical protein